jgi:hypothetical protein
MLTSPVAYPTPQPVARSAVKPVPVLLRADRVHACAVDTDRCLGCGRRCTEPARSIVLWKAGIGTTLRRALLALMFLVVGPVAMTAISLLLHRLGLPQAVSGLLGLGSIIAATLAVQRELPFLSHPTHPEAFRARSQTIRTHALMV